MRKRVGGNAQLVLAGNAGFGDVQYAEALHKGISEKWIIRTGFVDQADLPVLYGASKGVCYLSAYEGFGLPPLEALHCGAPVLVSDIQVLREVLGDAALYSNPDDLDDVGRQMEKMLNGDAHGDISRLPKPYSWRQAASETLALLKRVVEHAHRG